MKFSFHDIAANSLSYFSNFTEMGLLGWVALDFGIQWTGWAISSILKTDRLYDMLGTSSFGILAAGSLLTGGSITNRKVVVTAMVGTWAARLGSHLVNRIMQTGSDSRFEKIKNDPSTFFVAWTLQGVWVASTLSPVLVINTLSTAAPAMRLIDIAGISVFAAGLLMESIADHQKWQFKKDPANKGKFINTGLWAHSRHPNYFGEMLVWWGVWATCVPGLRGVQHVTVVSPVLVMLLLRYLSGIPILEAQADKRWGSLPEYQQYKASTNMLVPWFKSDDRSTR